MHVLTQQPTGDRFLDSDNGLNFSNEVCCRPKGSHVFKTNYVFFLFLWVVCRW